MSVVHVFVVYCMVHNPTMCRELEIAPAEGPALSLATCMKGVMMGNQGTFMMEGAEWRIRGGKCRQVPMNIGEIQAYLRAQVKP